jgi:hypothetical protein
VGRETFETVLEQTVFDGGPNRHYNEFCATIKEMKLQAVPTGVPAEASGK